MGGVVESEPAKIWREFGKVSGLEKDEFESYFTGCSKGYAILIGSTWQLEEMVPLEDLRGRMMGFRPPQSYHYWNRDELILLSGGGLVEDQLLASS